MVEVRAFRAHRPCTLEGRMIETGSPLPSAACSTATFDGA